MKTRMFHVAMPMFFVGAAFAGELGTGRENDIPDEAPPPAETETAALESLMQELLEWFDEGVEQ